MSNQITLLAVGRLKDKSLENLESEYLKRLNLLKLKIIEVKSYAQDMEKEAKEIENALDQISAKKVFLLRENGKHYDSSHFAKLIEQNLNQADHLCFIISGALSFSPSIINKYPQTISLSSLTFPHRFARIILVEQIYRAQTIITNHPYHH